MEGVNGTNFKGRTMKTLNDVKADMSALYEELRSGKVEIKQAAELANITGKYLKAEQLQLAREVFESNIAARTPRAINLPQAMTLEDFNNAE